jgi:RND superfamily putative drug exporter
MRLTTASRFWQVVIVAAWLLMLLAALPFAARVNDALDATARMEGSESARVKTALQERFHSPLAQIALLRLGDAPDPHSAGGRELLTRVVATLRLTPGVEAVASYLDRSDSLLLGQDDSPILVVGLNAPHRAVDATMTAVRTATQGLQSSLRAQYPRLTFQWTGEAAVNADLRRVSAAATRTAELRVLPITLLLLLVAFRSWVAATLPILCGATTVLVSLGVVSAVSSLWSASIIVVSIVSMVGLGLSIDYALLIVSRYRDELDQGFPRPLALDRASRFGGRTVMVSGATVAIGFAAMLLVRVSEIRSIGLGGLLVTFVAVLVASTLLPVLLAWLGPRVDAGQWGLKRTAPTGQRWRRWAYWVSRHPLRVLVVAGVPLVMLSAQAAHLRTDLPRGSWLPDSAESVRALHAIDSVGRVNFGQLIQVVLELPAGTALQDEAGWRATTRLVRWFAREPLVQHVQSITTLSTMPLAGPEFLRRVPDSVRSSLVSADGRSTLIEVFPRNTLGASEATRLAREIRAANVPEITGLAGARIEVGGVPGFNADYEDAIRASFPPIVGSVIVATLLVLSLAFRSVLIPIKAVALNLLSVAAAFGAVVVVIQKGYGSTLLGLSSPMDGGFPILPVLIFCIVFGLSMDYEVFIVGRIADGRRAGLDDASALAEGLGGTGRVITFAAAVMLMVFSGFMFGDFMLIKILGFALSVAVLLDATVVRLAVGPALIRLAGRWNWWPGR